MWRAVDRDGLLEWRRSTPPALLECAQVKRIFYVRDWLSLTLTWPALEAGVDFCRFAGCSDLDRMTWVNFGL